ncbi:proline-rich receptor-like protein kinase PERK9 [Penaeus chinensis]|uniref:proline-rich receptor-like protein kinase PERK9 n=1 Tax=Penaeus chinensis TaxID=139456 RepID=UPI001FB5BEAC|nr:proline-rich receptor-like protein kinase PERK9 [Penaeus chinensis]
MSSRRGTTSASCSPRDATRSCPSEPAWTEEDQGHSLLTPELLTHAPPSRSPPLTTQPATTTATAPAPSNPAGTPLPPVIPLMPFIVAPVFTPVVAGPPQDPPALPSTDLTPPSDSPSRPSLAPRLQRVFPSQRLIQSIRQEQSSSSSESTRETSSRTSTSQLLAAAGMLQKLEKSSSNSSSKSSSSSQQESSSSSLSLPAEGSSASNAVEPEGAAPPPPAKEKPAPAPASGPEGEKRGRILVPNTRRPVLRRPATPLTRPRSQVVQSPVSDDYINNFPEAAAPEGFPGEDPEEGTIRENLFELQRVN